MLLQSDFMGFEFEREIASDGNRRITVTVKPIDGSVKYDLHVKKRGKIEHFATLGEAIHAYNGA